MALPDEHLIYNGGSVAVWQSNNVGDFPAAANLANNSGAYARGKLIEVDTNLVAPFYALTCEIRFDGAAISGGSIDVYWDWAVNNSSWPMALSGASEGAEDGGLDTIQHFELLGAIKMHDTNNSITQKKTFIFGSPLRYGRPAIHNKSGRTLKNDSTQRFSLYPLRPRTVD